MHPILYARLLEARRIGTYFVQFACFVHLFNEHVFEIRPVSLHLNRLKKVATGSDIYRISFPGPQCSGASMCPTLNYSGDYLLSVRTTFLKTFLQRKAPHVSRGDLIDFVSPRDPSYSACKRVIGIEGDVVCLDPSDTSRTGKDQVWIRVPVGHLWVAGDNLSNSVDSREYGPLPLGLVRGKIMARVWPNPRWFTREGETSIK